MDKINKKTCIYPPQLEKCKSLDNFLKRKKPFLLTKKSVNDEEFKQSFTKEQKSIPSFYEEKTKIKRIKSMNTFQQSVVPVDYKNMIEIYDKENKNLLKQNKFLIKEIQKHKQNENALYKYIETLKDQLSELRKVEKKNYRTWAHQTPTQSKKSNITNVSSGKTLKQNLEDFQEHETRQLNKKFLQLIQQCSHQQNKSKRNIMRVQLAEIAHKMKNLRREN